jgi:hypothetical protein
MIKFFRHIRKSLLQQNKIGKYFFYAIGEIVLVVIGILIALNLNIRSEQKKSDAKIDAILLEVLGEISSNINETNRLMSYYQRKDSIYWLMKNEQLSYNDYKENKIPNLFNNIYTVTSAKFAQQAYDNLILNMESIPLSYKEVMDELKDLNNNYKKNVDTFDEHVRDFVQANVAYAIENYSWRSNDEELKEEIDYMLNDFKYRNKVFYYYDAGIRNHLNIALKYRYKAIECYKKIAALLNESTIDDSFSASDDFINSYIGTYGLIDNPSEKIYITKDNKRVFVSNKVNGRKTEIMQFSKTQGYATYQSTFFTLVEGNGNVIIKFNRGASFKKISRNQ